MGNDVVVMFVALAFGGASAVRAAVRAQRRNDWKAFAVSCIASWAGFLLAFVLSAYRLFEFPHVLTAGALSFVGMALWEERSARTWTPVANSLLKFIELSSSAYFYFLFIAGFTAIVRGCF